MSVRQCPQERGCSVCLTCTHQLQAPNAAESRTKPRQPHPPAVPGWHRVAGVCVQSALVPLQPVAPLQQLPGVAAVDSKAQRWLQPLAGVQQHLLRLGRQDGWRQLHTHQQRTRWLRRLICAGQQQPHRRQRSQLLRESAGQLGCVALLQHEGPANGSEGDAVLSRRQTGLGISRGVTSSTPTCTHGRSPQAALLANRAAAASRPLALPVGP